MKKLFIIAILFCCAVNVKAQLSPAYTARLQFVLDSVCARLKIKGVSAAVLVPNAGIWKGAYGESTTGNPITTDMLLGIGSNTKTYVSALMLKLQEMGKVNINDTIGTWFPNNPNISGQITIRQMLNHTSGIYNYTDNPNFSDSLVLDFTRIWQPEEIIPLILAPNFAAGTSWSYSNSNYLLAGIIIKQIMAQPINMTMRSMILGPQGMNHTIFFPQDTTSDPIPDSWSINIGNHYLTDIWDIPGYNNNALFSLAATAGGIMATAEDNVTFWHQLISGQIINAASMNQMLNFLPIGLSAGRPVSYGLGIFKYQNYMNGHTIYCHGGTNTGFINENMVDSITGVSISVLTNQDSITNSVLALNVVKALHKVTLDKSVDIVSVNSLHPSINAYPNPAVNNISLELTGVDLPAVLAVDDMSGREVKRIEINSKSSSVNISDLTPGLYIAKVMSPLSGIIGVQKISVAR